jgi:hypothetical protein
MPATRILILPARRSTGRRSAVLLATVWWVIPEEFSADRRQPRPNYYDPMKYK